MRRSPRRTRSESPSDDRQRDTPGDRPTDHLHRVGANREVAPWRGRPTRRPDPEQPARNGSVVTPARRGPEDGGNEPWSTVATRAAKVVLTGDGSHGVATRGEVPLPRFPRRLTFSGRTTTAATRSTRDTGHVPQAPTGTVGQRVAVARQLDSSRHSHRETTENSAVSPSRGSSGGRLQCRPSCVRARARRRGTRPRRGRRS